MGQLHFYVSDEIEAQIQRRAKRAHMPVSRYLASIIKREVYDGQWPEGYFEQVFGQWEGEPLQRPSQDEFETRLELD